MRKIKFRALNVDNQFIYGLPYTDSVNETLYYKDYNNRLCWRNEMGSSCNQAYKNGTLEQFTGLHDKNGKEIYEGDIIHLHQTVNGCKLFSVEWCDDRHGWTLRYAENMVTPRKYEYSIREVFEPYRYNGSVDYEVVGNIHEKKELLP